MELSKKDSGLVVVHTLRKQFEGYTKQDMEKAKLACDLQGMVGQPTEQNKRIWRETKSPLTSLSPRMTSLTQIICLDPT